MHWAHFHLYLMQILLKPLFCVSIVLMTVMQEASVSKIVCTLRQECLILFLKSLVSFLNWQQQHIFSSSSEQTVRMVRIGTLLKCLLWCNLAFYYLWFEGREWKQFAQASKMTTNCQGTKCVLHENDTSFCYTLIWSSFYFLFFQWVWGWEKTNS